MSCGFARFGKCWSCCAAIEIEILMFRCHVLSKGFFAMETFVLGESTYMQLDNCVCSLARKAMRGLAHKVVTLADEVGDAVVVRSQWPNEKILKY